MRDTDEQAPQIKVGKAFQTYQDAVAQLPYPGCFEFIHGGFKDLVEGDFHIPGKEWLNPFQLAHIANYVSLFGSTQNNYRPQFELNSSLNALKRLWSLAENENQYSENDDYIACFLLRWIYQQLPYAMDLRRVLRTCEIMRDLLCHSAVTAYIESSTSLTGRRLMDLSISLLGVFQRNPSCEESVLLKLRRPSDELRIVLKLFSADRLQRWEFHRQKLEVSSPFEKPYEINSLLQYPLANYEGRYYAPYPELVGYASARGLFFRFSEQGKQKFRDPFADSMEEFTARLLRTTLPRAQIVTEQQERELGWTGKANDVSVILGDTAILFECKASAFFVDAKRTAAPEAIIADLRKNLANGEKRKGLFQLYDKCNAIRSKELPRQLMERYKDVKRIFPVMLLFDAIEHANAAAVIGNIIKDELQAHRITGFDYQIWHLEELSWLAEFAGEAFVEWIAEKFLPDYFSLGLNSFVSTKTGNAFLNQGIYMPHGNRRALEILTELSAKEHKRHTA